MSSSNNTMDTVTMASSSNTPDTVAMAGEEREKNGTWETDVSYGGEVDLHRHLASCEKNPGHLKFVPVDQFNVEHLPPNYHDNKLVDLVRAISDLTVRVSVNYVSDKRPQTIPKTDTPYPYYSNRRSNLMGTGTGMVREVVRFSNESVKCNCKDCLSSKNPRTEFAYIAISTAAHIVYDKLEGAHTTCHLFFDRGNTPEDCNGVVTLSGMSYVEIYEESDTCVMTYETHDLDLIDKLDKMVCHYERMYNINRLRHLRPSSPLLLTIIVSHPHGSSKRVSVGYTSKPDEKSPQKHKCIYSTATCPGTSGAYVWVDGELQSMWLLRYSEDHLPSGYRDNDVVGVIQPLSDPTVREENYRPEDLDPQDEGDPLQPPAPANHVSQQSTLKRNNFGSCKQKWRTWLPFAAPLISCTVTLVVLIYATVVLRRTEVVTETEAVMQYSYPEVCVDCLKLVENPYKNEQDLLLDDLTKKQENGVLMCCAQNWRQMPSLLEAIMREQKTLSDLDDVEITAVSAHKAMKAESVEKVTSNEYLQDILKFERYYHDSRREHVEGVTVLKNGFVIQHSGVYFIYCSVAYRLDSPKTYKEDPREYLFSSIYRTRPNSAADSGVLLTSVHTKWKNCLKENETLFTGGSFYLKAGDFIQVLVSKREFVDFDGESTYLGLVLLGEKVT